MEWCHPVKVLPNFSSILLNLLIPLTFFLVLRTFQSIITRTIKHFQLNVLSCTYKREIWSNSRPKFVLFSPTEGEGNGVTKLAAGSGLYIS